MKHIIPLLLGATLVGCAGQAPNITQPVLVSEEPKPEWVTEHKLEDSTTMYFTGISTKYAEERKALKDAKGYRVARLPNIIVHQLAKKGILTLTGQVLDKPRFFKWLNDSDNRHFRIYTGNL